MSGEITAAVAGLQPGDEIAVTDWFAITQADVDAHAQLTGDDDWVHTDPERVRAEGLFAGTTIVQGSLILAQLVRLARALPADPAGHIRLNYGFDRVRFTAPLPTGRRVRARFRLVGVEDRGDRGVLSTVDVTFEHTDAVVAVVRWKGLTLPY
ncbi:MaoC/PaaZ C-terminal domain-containing protein [Micromonospora mirobrigensis]|uniref:Acyl dehydratase n=1 Tax=Micromonospora mirobrigensis TaxID=262898 RepID=A0A1C5AL02_9ACTN|nr:MaoC/PaaZ C-terminal domain-containing protein [Micromonospora mirobrigensis]SCF45910.1 Acyl dehydratase [Micromonospora mirobrigensis]